MSFRPIPAAPAVTGDWRDRAACLDEDPELFFPIGTTGPARLQIEEATAVCRRCDVMDTCRRWAFETGQDDGVWGGLSEDERRSMKRRDTRKARAAQPKPAATTTAKADPVTRPSCGRRRGFEVHTAHGEGPCDDCKAWHANHRSECGTGDGYRAHARRKDVACQPCKDANDAEYRRLDGNPAADLRAG